MQSSTLTNLIGYLLCVSFPFVSAKAVGNWNHASWNRDRRNCDKESYHSDPGSCTVFLAVRLDCRSNTVTVQRRNCPYGLNFHRYTKTCEYPWIADCKQTSLPSNDTKATTIEPKGVTTQQATSFPHTSEAITDETTTGIQVTGPRSTISPPPQTVILSIQTTGEQRTSGSSLSSESSAFTASYYKITNSAYHLPTTGSEESTTVNQTVGTSETTTNGGGVNHTARAIFETATPSSLMEHSTTIRNADTTTSGVSSEVTGNAGKVEYTSTLMGYSATIRNAGTTTSRVPSEVTTYTRNAEYATATETFRMDGSSTTILTDDITLFGAYDTST